MFLAHSFRLRDPWQCECTEDGATRWSRVFHHPTGLEPDDELVLVLSGLPDDAQIIINGHHFTTKPSERFTPSVPERADGFTPSVHQYNLTPILNDANQIEILLPASTPSPRASGLMPQTFPYDARLAVIGHS